MPFVIALIAHGDGWHHDVSLAVDSADDARAAIATLQAACPAVGWSEQPITLADVSDDADGLDGTLLARYIVGVERGALAEHADAAGPGDDLAATPGFVIKVQAINWATALALVSGGEPDLEQLTASEEPGDPGIRAGAMRDINIRLGCAPDAPAAARNDLLPAGASNKYRRVYVERVGRTGFDDVTEPVALLRAQDKHALAVLTGYLLALREDPAVPAAQLESVTRQVMAFAGWRAVNGVRTPGAPA